MIRLVPYPQEITQAKVKRTRYVEYVTTNLGRFFVFFRVRKEDEKRPRKHDMCMVPVSRKVSTPGKNSLFQLPLPDPSILILNPSQKNCRFLHGIEVE